jgi:4'-phosphopantetheinyl transferase EntD
MDESEPDRELERAIAGLAMSGVALGHRRLLPGDEDALLDEERALLPSSLTERRRASGAARIVARQLLEQFGYRGSSIPRGVDGEPLWPAGIIGSLSHDDEFAVAAVARNQDIEAIGIDIEPAVPLPPDMISLVFTPGELSRFANKRLVDRLIFAAKEAVYKAAFPLDRTFLEFQDIDVDLERLCASTRAGRTFSIRYSLSSRIIVLATSRSTKAFGRTE